MKSEKVQVLRSLLEKLTLQDCQEILEIAKDMQAKSQAVMRKEVKKCHKNGKIFRSMKKFCC